MSVERTMSPAVARYRKAEQRQLARYIIGKELTKDELLRNLYQLAEKHCVLGYVDLRKEWATGGYVLPWEREEGPGEPGTAASQGGTR